MSTLSSWLWGTSQLDEAVGKISLQLFFPVEHDGRLQTRLHPSSFPVVRKILPLILKYAIKYAPRVPSLRMLCVH